MSNIKSIVRLTLDNEDLEVKYFAKDDSLVDTYMDLNELLDYINELEENRDKAIKYEVEVYLSDLEWEKTHGDMGGVKGNIILKDNISYEDYRQLMKNTYFILCDKKYIEAGENKRK